MANDEDINDLPPENATTTQLLFLIRDLRREMRLIRAQQIVDSGKVEELTKAFGTAKSVTRGIKWLAALGAAIAAIVGVFRFT